MKKHILILLMFSLITFFIFGNEKSIYDFSPLDIEGNEVSLSDFQGKTLLIVNVASKCGFTPQYEGLETLYEQYKEKDFVILGFPSNDFLWQESGTNEEIKEFCTLNYGVTFPMFSKIKVTGRNKDPLYRFLTEKETNPNFSGRITWNFNKFLIDKNGAVINRFESATKPLSEEVLNAVKRAIN